MRDGRRQRLGLGTEDPATSNDGYLDRILSDAEAAEQSNILSLAQDANVNVRDQRYLNDAYQYYLGGGTGNFADEVAIAPDFIGGQLIDTGGGAGQATSGVDLGAGTGNTDFEQNLLDQGIGVQGAIGDPVVAPGEMLSTQAEMDAFNQIPVTPQTYADTGRADLLEQAGGEDYGDGGFQEEGSFDDQFQDIESIGLPETNIVDEVALTGQPTAVNDLGEITADDYGTNTFAGNTATLEDAGGTYDGNQSAEGGFGLESEFAPYGVNPNTGEAYQTPRSISDQNAVLGQTFAAEDVDTQGNLLKSGIDKMKSVFPDFNPIVAAGKIAFNSYIGAPVTLAFDALKAIGGMLPEQSAANKFNQSFTKGGANYKDYGYGVLQAGNIAQDPFGRNPVSAFGNYEETLAEDLNYEGTNKFNLDKKEFAEKYFKELNNNALLSGDINSANTDIDIDTGNVTGDASVAEDAQDLNLTDIKDDMAGINTGDAGVAEAAAAADRAAADLAASNAASVSMGEARYGDGGPGISTPTNEFSDEEFMAGDTSIAAPATGDTASDSFFDAADNAATSSPSLTDAQKQANSDAAIDAARGGGGSSGTLSQAQSTANIDAARGGEGGGGGGNKIVCTMMNDSYGFGSFRNKIWLKHSRDMAPEYQIGYHKIFLPLIKIAKTNKVVKKILEHIAVHRTLDIRQEARGKVHLLGRLYRKILEPLCYLVGKHG